MRRSGYGVRVKECVKEGRERERERNIQDKGRGCDNMTEIDRNEVEKLRQKQKYRSIKERYSDRPKTNAQEK